MQVWIPSVITFNIYLKFTEKIVHVQLIIVNLAI